MPAMTLARTLATAVCGVWLFASGVQPADAGEQVKTIQLRGGELRLVNNDERKPKAVINGREFLFEPDYVGHKETFQLSDRDIVVLTTDTGYRGLQYRVFSLTVDGMAREIDGLYFSWQHIPFIAKKKDDAVYFDLGYLRGLKIDAVVSPTGVDVSRRAVARPAFDPKSCKWIYEKVLDNCINDLGATCELMNLPSDTVFTLRDFEHHPRWKIADDRIDAACERACKMKKRPAYSQFAKNICGP